jgi:hypothetical protein
MFFTKNTEFQNSRDTVPLHLSQNHNRIFNGVGELEPIVDSYFAIEWYESEALPYEKARINKSPNVAPLKT